MMPTIESQLARYGQHLADLDEAGRLVAPTPGTPRNRRSLVLVAALVVFVAAVVGVAWRATDSSAPSVDQPPTGTVPVEVVTLPDTGGTACTNDGLCVKLSPPNAAASPDTVWFVSITTDGASYGSTEWSPCSPFRGFTLSGSSDNIVDGAAGIVPPHTPVVAIPGARVRQLAVSAAGDTISVIAVTGATSEVIADAVIPYLPPVDATPQACLDEFQRQISGG